jgi:hypothetical protein
MLDGDTGNINYSDPNPIEWVPGTPYHWGFHYSGDSLANYLRDGGPEKFFAGLQCPVKNWASEGEAIDGQRTVRVVHRLERLREGKTVFTRTDVVWLVPDRNWLPIRSELYERFFDGRGSMLYPVGVGTASDWTELQPGIWLARRSTLDAWESRDLGKGIRTKLSATTYTVTKAALDPKYDETFFRAVTFPPGCQVYEISGRKPIRTYVVGKEPLFGLGMGSGWSRWTALAAALIVGVAVVAWIKRRSRAQRPVPGSAAPG